MGADVEAAKRRLRRALAERRRAVPPEVAERAGEQAAHRLLAEPELAAASRVALYAALPGELPTRPLFEALRAEARPRLLPRAGGDRLVFVPVEAWEDLRPGRYRVLEPPPDAEPVELSERDLVVVPGVAFDERGGRLGLGAGFYDRTFPSGAPGRRVGLAFEFQIVDCVPMAPHDRPVEAIVTEMRTRFVGRRSG